MKLLTTTQIAEIIGASQSAVSRAARRLNLGIRMPDGRLTGIDEKDVPKINGAVRRRVGNPDWIAAGELSGKPKQRKRARKAKK